MITGTAAIPAHLAVHLLGLAVAGTFAVHASAQRERGWSFVTAGAGLLAVGHLIGGALLAAAPDWPVILRIAGYAGIAVGAAGGVRVGAAAVALPVLGPAAAPRLQVVAGVAGLAAAVSSLRGVLGAGSGLIAGGLALWAAGDFLAGTATWWAVAASILGSLLVGGGLLRRSRTSLLSQLAAAFVGALLLVVLGLSGLSGIVFGTDLERDELDRLETVIAARAGEIEGEWSESMLTVSRMFAHETLAGAMIEADPDRLERLAQSIAELPDTDVVVLLDADGRLLASYEWTVEPRAPLAPSDAHLIAGDEVVGAAAGGDGSRGVVILGQRDVIAIGAAPVYPIEDGERRRDRLAGTIVSGRRVTDPVFLDRLSATVDADVTLVLAGLVATSSLPGDLADDAAAAVAAGVGRGIVPLGDGTAFLAAHEIGPDTGAWLTLTRDAAAVAGAVKRFTRTIFLIAVAGLATALVLAAWASRRLTRPVLRLTGTAEQIAAGDLEARTQIDRPDEVGRLARAFDHMTDSLAHREEDLRRAAATEAALRERLEVLTASMDEALVAIDGDGRVQMMNPAAAALLGVTREEADGLPVRELVVGVDEVGGDLLDALGGPDVSQLHAARGGIQRGDRVVPVAATAAPLRSGAHRGRVYVLRDTTRELEVERMKTAFLSNLSHELRTPLTPIKGYAAVLRRRDLPRERVQEFASSIVQATDRLERIIGMLVDFAALEAGRVEIHLRPTPLDPVVSGVLDAWHRRRPDRSFGRDLPSDLPDVVVDERLLARVLEELIDNAVKFSRGPVRIHAAADGEASEVRLTVSDDGEGIDADELEAIVEDFRQVDGSSTRQHGGLGLGLSLVHRITQRFGARIVVRSEVGHGTEVDLLLPVSEEVTP